MYQVSEMYRTIQGEATNMGRTAVFVRFAGCNLWNGREYGRSAPACAAWCDVVPLEREIADTAGMSSFAARNGPMAGGYTGEKFVNAIWSLWGDGDDQGYPFVVLTGGEPTLQFDDELFDAMKSCEVAVETNGTTDIKLPPDWFVTVSPKGDTRLHRTEGDELKLIVPQRERGAHPDRWQEKAELGDIRFDRYYLQPMEPVRPLVDGLKAWHDRAWKANIDFAKAYVQDHPFWRLSVQTHKMLDLP